MLQGKDKNMNQDDFFENETLGTAFLFIPMDLDHETAEQKMGCETFREELEKGDAWKLKDDKDSNRYIYRYITDKMDLGNKADCLYLHYCLADEAARKRGWGEAGRLYRIKDTDIRFQIQTVHLFTFKTEIKIAAIQLEFAKDAPLYIAEGLYYLKKVHQEMLIPDAQMEETETILEAVRGLFPPCLKEKLRFFPYLNEGMERANTMSLAFEPEREKWKEHLYFLKNAYRTEGFFYNEWMDQENETLFTSGDYVWGVTGENLACLVLQKTEHVTKRFQKRFQEEYLLIYILLLHRKFDLYKILTDFGIGEQNDLQTLKSYQKHLNIYRTDYEYERITEVPQYHNLYKKIEERMELTALFDDVMEPVSELSSMQMEWAEEVRAEQEGKMERALAALSFLAIFSALIDGCDYLQTLIEDFMGEGHLNIIVPLHVLCSFIILFVGMRALMNFRGVIFKKGKKNNSK